MFKVSQSKVKTWRRCHYAYHLRYVEKLRKKVKSRPLQFGTIVHSMLEAHAEGDDPFDALRAAEETNEKLFAAEQEIYGEIIDDIRQIMTEYFAYYEDGELKFDRRNRRNSEFEFEVELMDGVLWNGKIDAIGRTPNKLRWIVENKTFTRKPNDDERWRNLQSSTYIRLNEMMGWPHVEGMCWNYIRSKSPTKPGILKDGSLSQKSIDTLPITVRETIHELGLDPKDYSEFLAKTNEKLGEWFSRIHTPVNRAVVDNIFDDFMFSIREMMEGHGRVKDKNIDKHCGWCDYQALCRTELESGDVDYMMQHDYTRSSRGDEDLAVTPEN